MNGKIYLVEGCIMKTRPHPDRINRRVKVPSNRIFRIRQAFINKNDAVAAMNSCNKISDDAREIWCHALENWLKHVNYIKLNNYDLTTEIERTILDRQCDINSTDCHFYDFKVQVIDIENLSDSERKSLKQYGRSMPVDIFHS